MDMTLSSKTGLRVYQASSAPLTHRSNCDIHKTVPIKTLGTAIIPMLPPQDSDAGPSVKTQKSQHNRFFLRTISATSTQAKKTDNTEDKISSPDSSIVNRKNTIPDSSNLTLAQREQQVDAQQKRLPTAYPQAQPQESVQVNIPTPSQLQLPITYSSVTAHNLQEGLGLDKLSLKPKPSKIVSENVKSTIPLVKNEPLKSFTADENCCTSLENIITKMNLRFNSNEEYQAYLEAKQTVPDLLCQFYGRRENVPDVKSTINRDFNLLNTDMMHRIISGHIQSPMINALTFPSNTNIPLEIVFEDKDLIVINKVSNQLISPKEKYLKPTGIIYVKNQRNPNHNTTVNGLIKYCPLLHTLPKCGLIHRLDFGTSGLLMVAKSIATMSYMCSCDKIKEYLCIVDGIVDIENNEINKPLPSRADPKKLQEAKTYYQVDKQYKNHALVSCRIITGRMNQVRLHMLSIGHPLVGDRQFNKDYMSGGAYDNRVHYLKKKPLFNSLSKFSHAALHSHKLTFIHPRTDKKLEIKAPIPKDFSNLLKVLEDNSALLGSLSKSTYSGAASK